MSALLLGFDLGGRVLATNDEARFPVMAQDILSNGHWLLPETSAGPMLNKPPLHAWLIALCAWPFGVVSQRTAVVPSLLGALGVMVGTCWIAWRLFDAETAFAASLIVPTTAGMFAMARSAVPDMTLSLGIVAAMAAFVAAELQGRHRAWLAFYGLVGLACFAKGPAGLLPLAVVAVYEMTTFGWAGARRMRPGAGVAILTVVIAPWWVLATYAGRDQFLHDVVQSDLLQGYNPLRALSWSRVVGPLSAAATIGLPWSLLLPFAVRPIVRRWKTESADGERLALLWSLVVFVLVALSARQRWRYYLPLCVPVALLIARWLSGHRVWRETTNTVAIGAVTATLMAAGGTYATARDNHGTHLQMVARALGGVPGPLFALDAPELVFSFYLKRPVQAISSMDDVRALDPPLYVVARDRPAESFERVAASTVRGRPFGLWVMR